MTRLPSSLEASNFRERNSRTRSRECLSGFFEIEFSCSGWRREFCQLSRQWLSGHNRNSATSWYFSFPICLNRSKLNHHLWLCGLSNRWFEWSCRPQVCLPLQVSSLLCHILRKMWGIYFVPSTQVLIAANSLSWKLHLWRVWGVFEISKMSILSERHSQWSEKWCEPFFVECVSIWGLRCTF